MSVKRLLWGSYAVAGRQNKPWQREDEGCTFIDNLKAYVPGGFSLVIR